MNKTSQSDANNVGDVTLNQVFLGKTEHKARTTLYDSCQNYLTKMSKERFKNT